MMDDAKRSRSLTHKVTRRPTHFIRIMSPMGIYPNSFNFNESFFSFSKDICYSTIPYSDSNFHEPLSDVQWLSFTEIKLYSALSLSKERDEGLLIFYPYPFFIPIEGKENNSIIDDIPILIDQILAKAGNSPDENTIDKFGCYIDSIQNYRDIIPPPCLGGKEYNVASDIINFKNAGLLYENINVDDKILMRGLSTLLKANMLHIHEQFLEEAINTLYISLEASFRLVIRRLRILGNPQPSSIEAMNYISTAFNEKNRYIKYFEEDYDRRIKSLHPENRFGSFSHPPMIADDYYELYADLVEVYKFLIINYVHPRYFIRNPKEIKI